MVERRQKNIRVSWKSDLGTWTHHDLVGTWMNALGTWMRDLDTLLQEKSFMGSSTAILSLETTLSDTPDQIFYIMGYALSRNNNNNSTSATIMERQRVNISLECILYLVVLLETLRLIVAVLRE